MKMEWVYTGYMTLLWLLLFVFGITCGPAEMAVDDGGIL